MAPEHCLPRLRGFNAPPRFVVRMNLLVPAHWVFQPFTLRRTQRCFDLRTYVGFANPFVRVGHVVFTGPRSVSRAICWRRLSVCEEISHSAQSKNREVRKWDKRRCNIGRDRQRGSPNGARGRGKWCGIGAVEDQYRCSTDAFYACLREGSA